jgi:hypothetical protein
MTSDITVSTLAYKLIYSDKTDGSLRRETARGASLPTELSIKHSDYVDSKTKVSGKRTLVRLDHYMTMTDGVIRPVSFYCVLARPDDPLVTAAIITALEAQMVNLLHGTTNTSGLDLEGEILSNREQ